MKLSTLDSIVERGNVAPDQQFSIKATAKSFEILSSSLYSDKILAIVRELACNAADAHTAAGNSHEPIIIKLPTQFEPTFSIIDYGIGLSHEDVTNLYTTYFDSTKQDSNDFIGALGLGSKSPFSYTSNFTVESRFDGMVRVYACFKNEQGLPSITILSEDTTTDRNGLTITISVKSDDIGKFIHAAKRALMYFDPTPIVNDYIDFKPYYLRYTMVGHNWKMREADYFSYIKGPYVVQGFVSYPIDRSILCEHGLSAPAQALLSTDVDFFVDIGDVDVAASRESLSYDKRTIKNLIVIVEQAAAELQSTIQRQIDTCITEWEWIVFMDKMVYHPSADFKKTFNAINAAHPFTWNGLKYTGSLTVDVSNCPDLYMCGYINYAETSKRATKYNQFGLHPGETEYSIKVHHNLTILVDYDGIGGVLEYKRYTDTVGAGYDKKKRLLVIRPNKKKADIRSQVDTLLQLLGNPEYSTVEQVGFEKKVTGRGRRIGTVVKRSKEEKLLWIGFPTRKLHNRGSSLRRVFSTLCWDYNVIDMTKGGFYVPIERFTIKHTKSDRFDIILSNAYKMDLLDKNAPIYGFKQSDIDNIADDEEWVNLFDYMSIKFSNLNSTGTLSNTVYLGHIKSTLSNGFFDFITNNWATISDQLIDGPFKSLITKCVNKINVDIPPTVIIDFCYYMDIKYVAYDVKSIVNQEFAEIIEAYPLLQHIKLVSLSADSYMDVINYMVAMDTQLTLLEE